MKLVLDAGAFIAVDRNQRSTVALLVAARDAGIPFATSANVVAQVWRNERGRQAHLGRFLRSVSIQPVDNTMARQAGILLGKSKTRDVVDATLVLIATPGDQIVTSDRPDLERLAKVVSQSIQIVDC
jgi:predicted nucleic acid-binding protein